MARPSPSCRPPPIPRSAPALHRKACGAGKPRRTLRSNRAEGRRRSAARKPPNATQGPVARARSRGSRRCARRVPSPRRGSARTHAVEHPIRSSERDGAVRSRHPALPQHLVPATALRRCGGARSFANARRAARRRPGTPPPPPAASRDGSKPPRQRPRRTPKGTPPGKRGTWAPPPPAPRHTRDSARSRPAPPRREPRRRPKPAARAARRPLARGARHLHSNPSCRGDFFPLRGSALARPARSDRDSEGSGSACPARRRARKGSLPEDDRPPGAACARQLPGKFPPRPYRTRPTTTRRAR